MDAAPILGKIAAALSTCRLEAVLIGNAAAALHGAPVTTVDFDFMFRKTPANLEKLKRLADLLGGQVLRPYYPMSGLYRLMVDDAGWQLDFMSVIHGVKSYGSLRSRAHEIKLGNARLLLADLADIIQSKKTADRARDVAVLEILEKTWHEQGIQKKKRPARSPKGK